MLRPTGRRGLAAGLLLALVSVAGCRPDRMVSPESDQGPGGPLLAMHPDLTNVIVPMGGGSFVALNPMNVGRATGPFWDNQSADTPKNQATETGTAPPNHPMRACNIGFYANGTFANAPFNPQDPMSCMNEAPGSNANLPVAGVYTMYYGRGGGSREPAPFMFNGAFGYRVTLLGAYHGARSELGIFTKTNGTYAFSPVDGGAQFGGVDWGNVGCTSFQDGTCPGPIPANASITIPAGADWGLYIRNSFNPEAGGCRSDDTDCSDATGGFTTAPKQQFVLFANASGTTYLVGTEDNALELGSYWTAPGIASRDSDYQDYILKVEVLSPASLGDRVWRDNNGNGVQNAGEPGLPNVPVSLFQCSNNTQVGATISTDANGIYGFTNLSPGSYYVQFGTLPNHTRSPRLAQGADPSFTNNNDSNADPTTGQTDCVTLAAGESNLTIDAGLIPSADVCPTNPNLLADDPSCSLACPAGSFEWRINADGDLVIKYDQFPAPNDNSYGVNSVGWGDKVHKFGNLTGSDRAGFQLKDPGGVVRLSFTIDYLSSTNVTPATPSGYASLGPFGGDGKVKTGTLTPSDIIYTTSLARNLNETGYCSAGSCVVAGVNLLENSPPTQGPNSYGLTNPAHDQWDFHNTYFVTIKASKLASMQFDPATWTVEPNEDELHNSPAKPCPVTAGGGACDLRIEKTEFKDQEVKVQIKNLGSSDLFLTEAALQWPNGTNGALTELKKDAWKGMQPGPQAVLNSTVAGWQTDQNKLKLKKGDKEDYVFKFAKKPISSTLNDYLGTLKFGPDCVIDILGGPFPGGDI